MPEFLYGIDIKDGVKEIQALVQEYDDAIAGLHDEAAFELSEAALALFQNRKPRIAKKFACAALGHAGMSKKLSGTLLNTLQLLQQLEEKDSQRRVKGVKGRGL